MGRIRSNDSPPLVAGVLSPNNNGDSVPASRGPGPEKRKRRSQANRINPYPRFNHQTGARAQQVFRAITLETPHQAEFAKLIARLRNDPASAALASSDIAAIQTRDELLQVMALVPEQALALCASNSSLLGFESFDCLCDGLEQLWGRSAIARKPLLLNSNGMDLITDFDRLVRITKLVPDARADLTQDRKMLIQITSFEQLCDCIQIWPDLMQQFLFTSTWVFREDGAQYRGIDFVCTSREVIYLIVLLEQHPKLLSQALFEEKKFGLLFTSSGACREHDMTSTGFYRAVFHNPKGMVTAVKNYPDFAERILFNMGGIDWLTDEDKRDFLKMASPLSERVVCFNHSVHTSAKEIPVDASAIHCMSDSEGTGIALPLKANH